MSRKRKSFQDRILTKIVHSDPERLANRWKDQFIRKYQKDKPQIFKFSESSTPAVIHKVAQHMTTWFDVQFEDGCLHVTVKDNVSDMDFKHRLFVKDRRDRILAFTNQVLESFEENFEKGESQTFVVPDAEDPDFMKGVINRLKLDLKVQQVVGNRIVCALKPLKEEEVENEAGFGRILCWTDGSCIKHPSGRPLGGIGVYFGDGDSRNISRPLRTAKITNNTAELQAVIEALKSTQGPIEIRMDSQYVQKGATQWFDNWKRKGETHRPNFEMFQEIKDLMFERDVTLTWVRRELNKEADALSRCYDVDGLGDENI